MIWDFYLLIAAVLVTVAFWLATRKGQKNLVLGLLAVVAAVAVVIVEAWMLATMAARPLFAGGLMAVNFLIGAAVMGLSLALIAGVDKEKAARWLVLALIAALVLALSEGLTSLLSVEERAATEARALLTGWAAPLFWLQIVAGIIIPLVILRSKSLLWLAGILAIVGVLAEKSWLLAVGQSLPWVPQSAASYLPGLLEIVAVIGVAGIGMLIYLLLKKFAQ
jgi:molybdopterin-containing oxidoreductase family membrane subunit